MSATITAPERRGLHSPWIIFWAAFVVRVLYITLAHTYRITPVEEHFQFGFEMGRIARALATGYGYADPFIGHSGPTSWCPPLYPFLIAGVFKLFGVYTNLSAWVIFTLNSVCSAATAVAIYEIAVRCYGAKDPQHRIALWSAWIWALYPAAMQYAVHWVWDMAVTACFFTWAIVFALRIRGIGTEPPTSRQRTRNWALFGLFYALVVLGNPSPILFLPVAGLWVLAGTWQRRLPLVPELGRAVLAGVIFCACLAPWTIRNYVVFHTFIPMRGNFGAEFQRSLLEENWGLPWGPTVPPVEQDPVFQKYRSMGELAYVKEQGEIANRYLATHHERFVHFALWRVYYYWIGLPKRTRGPFGLLSEIVRELNYGFASIAALLGLALSLKNRISGVFLFAAAFLLLPLTYYFVTVQPRFRHPIEPLITILGVYLFYSAVTDRRWSWRRTKG